MQLTQQFLKELVKLSTTSKSVVDLLIKHLKYSYLPNEAYKKIFTEIINYYETNKNVPTLGVISQNINDPEVTTIIDSCIALTIPKKEAIISSLQEYIKKAKFVELHTKVAEMYNQSKHAEAIAYLNKESGKIHEFSLLNTQYTKIFAGHEDRVYERIIQDKSSKYIKTHIPQFDYFSRGGLEMGRGILAVGRSGTGKSYFLRQLGYSACMHGYDVIHFQAEGTKAEVTEYYDSMWSDFPVYQTKMHNFDHEEETRLEKTRQQFIDGNKGEIYVVAYEQFEKASILDCRNTILEIQKESKNLGMVIFDYLEKFMPGDRLKYGASDDQQRFRKATVAEKIINLAVEFNVVTATATQASEISKNEWNDPTFVITRSNIANLKATIDAFSYCITLNQTEDEADDEVIRIHEEKQRSYYTAKFNKTYKIKQKRDLGLFVDIAGTNELFWDDELKKHKK